MTDLTITFTHPKHPDFEEVTIHRVDEPDLKFTGDKLAFSTTREHDGQRSTRWDEANLYITKSGKFVYSTQHVTCWQGERDIFETAIYDTVEDLVHNVGFNELSKDIYAEARIEVFAEL